SRKLGKPFMAVPKPRGLEKQRLLDAYFSKRGMVTNQSDPLRPKQLARAKSKLTKEQYNWFYLSVWLGLRPMEIDQIKDSRNVRVQQGLDGTPVVWIYQTKLTAVPPRYRWKLIPLFLKEQRAALSIIASGKFKRPLVKTAKRYFGPHVTLYGGR